MSKKSQKLFKFDQKYEKSITNVLKRIKFHYFKQRIILQKMYPGVIFQFQKCSKIAHFSGTVPYPKIPAPSLCWYRLAVCTRLCGSSPFSCRNHFWFYFRKISLEKVKKVEKYSNRKPAKKFENLTIFISV